MYLKNINEAQLDEAMSKLNEKFDNNITINSERVSKYRIKFTLGVKNSRAKGGRIGFSGRRVAKACWHTHGELFDILLEINNEAEIKAGQKVINKEGGNWQDWNIGSMIEPMYYSEACDC